MSSLAHSLDWEKICGKLKLPFKKRSTGTIITLCPFHYEKTPSLHMWVKSGNFRCHGCGTRGSQKQFLAGILKVPEESLEIEDEEFYKLCEDPGQLKLDYDPYNLRY